MNDNASSPVADRINVFCDNDLTADFRVVVRHGVRRGIRLERIFWSTLKQFAEHRKITVGEIVEEIADASGQASNLASAIRVACMGWLASQNVDLRGLASLRTINAILGACPAPAFALSSSKKILTFNPAFQLLVRRQLPIGHGDNGHQDLRLSLDLNVADIFLRLDASDGAPITSGFVIGAAERRHRGKVNMVRAPIKEPELLMAFVVNG